MDDITRERLEFVFRKEFEMDVAYRYTKISDYEERAEIIRGGKEHD